MDHGKYKPVEESPDVKRGGRWLVAVIALMASFLALAVSINRDSVEKSVPVSKAPLLDPTPIVKKQDINDLSSSEEDDVYDSYVTDSSEDDSYEGNNDNDEYEVKEGGSDGDFAAILDKTIKSSMFGWVPQNHGLCFAVNNETVCSENATTQELELILSKTEHTVPDFFLAGYSESGSEWLNELLLQHPMIDRPVQAGAAKGLNWLDQDLYARRSPKSIEEQRKSLVDLADYFSKFKKNGENLVGDFSPALLVADPIMPVWVRAISPDTKIIIVVPDPIQKLLRRFTRDGPGTECQVSNSAMLKRMCKIGPGDLDEFLRLELFLLKKYCSNVEDPRGEPLAAYTCRRNIKTPPAALDLDPVLQSLFAQHLRHWLRFFKKEQFLFVRTEDLLSSPELTLKRVTEFLEVDPFENFSDVQDRIGPLPYGNVVQAKITKSRETSLRKFFSKSTEKAESITGLSLSAP